MSFGRNWTAACLILSVLPAPALAQDAGSLLRERQQQRQREQQALPEQAKVPEVPQKALPVRTGNGPTVIIRRLRFTGKSTLLSPAEQNRLSAGASGHDFTLAGLQTLADKVTLLLQQNGHLLARAVLPPQDVTAGELTIEIAEGTLGGIGFQKSKGARIRDDVLDGIVKGRVPPGDGLQKRDLESALLRMNSLPGVDVHARLSPGKTPNTSRLDIGVKEGPILGVSVGGDNYGDAHTGRAEGTATVRLNDLTGYGDATSFQGIYSEGVLYGRVDVGAPIGSSGLTARLGFDALHYKEIDAAGKAAGLNGDVTQFSAGMGYSLVRSRDFNLNIDAEFDHAALIDDSFAGRIDDKRVDSGTLTLFGDKRDTFGGGGLTSWNLSWTPGYLDLSRVPGSEAADAAGLGTQGSFHRIDASLARLQALPGNFSLFTRLTGQWANKNLDSSQEFSLGGPYALRAWPVGEGRGDMGFIATAELRYDVPAPREWGNIQLAAFVDTGRIKINKDPKGIPLANACGCNSYGLSDAGVGVRWHSGTVDLDASYAHALGGNPGRSAVDGANADGRHDQQAFWLRASVGF